MEKDPETIIDLLNSTAELYPEQVGIVSRSKKWKYTEIDRAGNQVANYFQALATKENVIICMNRSDWMIIAILGILKSGNTYIPIDALTPPKRVYQVIDITSPKFIITDEHNADKFKDFSNVILINQLIDAISVLPDGRVKNRIDEEDIAYIIFTSGTTGIPKGVPIFHKSLLNKIYNFNPDLDFIPAHNFILLASIAFDASIGQIFLPLTHGSGLHIISLEDQNNPVFFWNYLIENKINIIYTIPSLLNALLEYPGNLKNISVDYILLGAELFPVSLLNKIRTKLTVQKIVNMYGPTEVTVNAVMHVMTGEAETTPKAIPIGSPLPGYEIFILDKNHNIIKRGQTGEIAIAGVGLSPGYYKDPELSKEKFIVKRLSGLNKRIYLTGDYGCLNFDNRFEFFGRQDSQVKINGFRIELLEIEKAIKDNSAVKHCLVCLNGINNDQIIAFVEFTQGGSASGHTDKLSGYLKTMLPHYMIPRKIVQVDVFPMLISGKPNKPKLFSLLEDRNEDSKPGNITVSNIEDTILEIWKEIFDDTTVRRTDNFMDLGGGSIQSIILVNKLLQQGIQIQPSDIFIHPTVSELAKVAKFTDAVKPIMPQQHKNTPVFSFSNNAIPAAKNAKVWKSKIESIGAYVPGNLMSTKEVMEGCVNRISFPIERLTGIKNRGFGDASESSYKIAFNAVENCLQKSTLTLDEIDLLICCSTVRTFESNIGLFEPSFSSMLKCELGLKNALSFDVNNACAGMFTGIEIADTMMRNGTIKHALVVSGEHLTPVTIGAQQELVNDKFDKRLACLTLGDGGVAITLSQSTDNTGFEFLHLLTLGEYSDLTEGKVNREGNGGAIMFNDSIRAAIIGITPGIMHVFHSMNSKSWNPEMIDHYILHQTSITTIRNAMREMNILAGKAIVTSENVIVNLENRGNTASNCQLLAFYDSMRNGKIKSKSKIVFPVSGAGRTFGTALYTVDELPDRLNIDKNFEASKEELIPTQKSSFEFGVRIANVSVDFPRELSEAQTKKMNKKAALKCLAESDLDKNDIGLIIYSGVYRDECITEPAHAAIAAGELEINSSEYLHDSQSTFCFDILNGPMGTFNAVQVASEYIRAGKVKAALIITSETNYNRTTTQPAVSPLEMGSAILLSQANIIQKGMGKFANNSDCNQPIEKKVCIHNSDSETYLKKEIFLVPDPQQTEDAIFDCIKTTLSINNLTIEQVDKILLSGAQEGVVIRIAKALGIDRNIFYIPERVDVDFGSSEIFYNLDQYMNQINGIQQKTILIIGYGDGLTTGGVSYEF